MSLKQRLNRAISATLIILSVPTASLADRIVKQTSTTFGRIKSLDHKSVGIALGCSGDATQNISWNDIDPFGGIVFGGECNANWHASTSGATAEGAGPTATWFAVAFNDNTFLWAEQVQLNGAGNLKVTVAKGKGRLNGPIKDVRSISRKLIYVNTINPSDFKWPTSFKH